MTTVPVSPRLSLRIGHAPRLSRRERTARLLTRLGVYALAWGLVGQGCFWMALGDPAGYGFIALGGLACGLLSATKRRAPRARTVGDLDRRAHHSESSASSPVLLGGLGRRAGG